jgi:alpha-tubulin suppressor-like RCC1 family protein
MSQEKAQLIAPIGIMTVSGMTATGVITATSFTGNIVGSAKSLVNGTDVTAGVVTGTSFVGNLTGNIQRLADSAPNINVGVTTATSFVGNLTGSVTDLTSQPAITVGLVTATSLSGPITGNVTGDVDGDVTGNVTGTISGNVTGNVTGNATGTSGGLGINYNGGWTGAGTSQVRVGVITATFFHGDGGNLDGVSSGPVSQQAVTIDGAATSIDLSSGNLIYATQSADTTVSFANTENGNVYFVRTKDDTSTARTITWPDRIKWDGGTAPTLLDNPRSTDAQVFLLVTRDMGVTWYGKEVVNIDPQSFTMFTWGGNNHGQLALNDEEQSNMKSSPTQVGTDTNWKYGQFGYTRNGMLFASATKTDGTLWSWGYNPSGVLGQNDRNSRSSPTQIPGTTWNRSTGAGENNMLATKTDGTLWAWGSNSYSGPLGLNHRNDVSSPTQLPGTWGTSELSICGYNYWTAGIKADGTLWTWGNNVHGQLGVNYTNPNKLSSPTQVGTDTDWLKLQHSGAYSMGCIKTNGSFWTWGDNSQGHLGQNNKTRYSSPTQVPGTWSQASNGYFNTFGIKTNGTLWAWGYNDSGQLGHNNETKYSSPTQIPGTNWSTVVGADLVTYATKTDGTAWSWGFNDKMALGHNQPVNTKLSSPTQIPGTSWEIIYAVQNMGMGFQKAG